MISCSVAVVFFLFKSPWIRKAVGVVLGQTFLEDLRGWVTAEETATKGITPLEKALQDRSDAKACMIFIDVGRKSTLYSTHLKHRNNRKTQYWVLSHY